jgi:rRNA maturation endonuclease Nob1
VTRPLDTRRCCGEVPCTCEARKAAARAKAASAAQGLPAAQVIYRCRCALCGTSWTAREMGDCPGCGGLRRVRGGS